MEGDMAKGEIICLEVMLPLKASLVDQEALRVC
jgi:hypothetical protein